jgi:hypothetical protein
LVSFNFKILLCLVILFRMMLLLSWFSCV